MIIQNKIGLEAEYFLRDKKGELVFPDHYGFSTDEFKVLAEFRASPGEHYAETVGNFFRELSAQIYRAKDKGLTPDFSGVAEVSPEFYAEVIRTTGMKGVPFCKNVYGTDLLKYSDNVVTKTGQITSSRISAGLHVHFSRQAVQEIQCKKGTETYNVNLLTNSQVKRIVRQMDKKVLPNFAMKVPLKYRMPGFYEKKSYGFEYRSLPMTGAFLSLATVMDVVATAFSLLEQLEK
jgi:hypothetical protein